MPLPVITSPQRNTEIGGCNLVAAIAGGARWAERCKESDVAVRREDRVIGPAARKAARQSNRPVRGAAIQLIEVTERAIASASSGFAVPAKRTRSAGRSE